MRFLLVLLFLAPICFSAQLPAQDVVIARSQTSSKSIKRKGTIVDWTGDSLTISNDGNERVVDNDLIVQVQTDWNDSYLAGRNSLAKYKFEESIAQLTLALEQETRPWAKLMIRARLVEAFRGTQDHFAAIQQFLEITQVDPQTRFYHLIPIPWTSSFESANVVATAKKLANSKDVTARLIAASWMLNDTRDPSSRATAIAMLERLANDIEPRISQLASAQLWRTQIVSADEETVARWSSVSSRFDQSVRFGARFVVAEAQSRLGKNDLAAVEFMSLPILYPDQHAVIPAALYKCGDLLQNNSRPDEATLVWKELAQKYPDTFWAKQISGKLQPQN